MKLNGIIGKGTGKLGSSVFAISGGEQVVREYNPVVSNPNTDAQVAQRAKLKLMSQLGAALAPALGFAKMGLVSARNQFVSKNIAKTTYENNTANAPLQEIQLTPSNVQFPAISAVAGASSSLGVQLASAAAADIKRVAIFVYKQTENEKLEYVTSKVVTEAGEGRNFPTTFSNVPGDLVVYAYGIKDNNAKATIRFNDYITAGGDTSATLHVSALFRSTDYGLTATSGDLVTIE